MAAFPMYVFKFFIIDAGEQRLNTVHNPPILQRVIAEDVTWILRKKEWNEPYGRVKRCRRNSHLFSSLQIMVLSYGIKRRRSSTLHNKPSWA